MARGGMLSQVIYPGSTNLSDDILSSVVQHPSAIQHRGNAAVDPFTHNRRVYRGAIEQAPIEPAELDFNALLAYIKLCITEHFSIVIIEKMCTKAGIWRKNRA